MSDAIDRREFAHCLTLGAAAAATGAMTGEPSAYAADEVPSLPALVLARIQSEFPSDKYDEDVVKGILQDIGGDLARSRELSAFPLQNGDEPAFLFPASRRCRVAPRPAEGG
jgi:hypothetical protein